MILSEMIKENVSVVALNGKQPIEKGWQRWSEELRPKSAANINGGNYGIVCGPASGLIVLDIDNESLFRQQKLETPKTAAVKTANGYHLYYKYPAGGEKYSNAGKSEELGFDIRGYGGQVVGPGSFHPDTKAEYKIVRDIEPVDAPGWMLEFSGPKSPKKPQIQPQPKKTVDISPLEDYNQKTHPMDLLPGWEYNGRSGTWDGKKTEYIVRPGKDQKQGHSGSIVHTGDSKCPFLFYNFSSNSGFVAEKSYTPADLYAELNYGGDMNLAAKTLFEQGFGSKHAANVAESANVANVAIVAENEIVAETLFLFDALCQNDTPLLSYIYKRYDFHDAPSQAELEKKVFLDNGLNSLQKRILLQSVAIVAQSDYRSRIGRADVAQAENRKWKEISPDVNEWIYQSSGHFTADDIYRAFSMMDEKLKKCARSLLSRMKKKDIIEPVGNRNGVYRLVERDLEEINFKNADTGSANIKLPFGMHDLIEIMPGNIIIFAGEQNAGKTAIMLNVVRDNMKTSKCHYYSSEMGDSELNKRLQKFEGLSIEDWNFRAYERASEFADVIVPGAGNINFIDYLEMHTDFWRISEHLAKIHTKLDGAIAIIAIQKDKNADVGRGSSFSLEKPRLYCTVASGKLKMYKAKNWATDVNPNGLCIDYSLVQGCKIIPGRDNVSGTVAGWYREGEKNKKHYLKDE